MTHDSGRSAKNLMRRIIKKRKKEKDKGKQSKFSLKAQSKPTLAKI